MRTPCIIFLPATLLQPLVLLMEWPDASNFACLISGYYKLFVDPKRNIYFRISGQFHLSKTGMLEDVLSYSGSFQTRMLPRNIIHVLKHSTRCKSQVNTGSSHMKQITLSEYSILVGVHDICWLEFSSIEITGSS